MLELSILKIEDPSCMWGKIMSGPGLQVASKKDYDDLQVEMNLYYHDVNLDPQSVKPSSIEKGQLCVVFSPLLLKWCRAIVESVYQGADGTRATCFLVDHVEDVSVTEDGLCVLLEKFLRLPFRVRKFRLAGIYPLSLRMSIIDAKAELVPSVYWDCSASRYLYILWQASSLVEAVVCGSQPDCLDIELYLTINRVKICVNHDLLAKRFACTKTEKESLQKEGRGLPPVFLKGDMFSSPEKFLALNGFAVKLAASGPMPELDQMKEPLEQTTDETPCGEVCIGAQNTLSERVLKDPATLQSVTLKSIQTPDGPCDAECAGDACSGPIAPLDLQVEEDDGGSELSDKLADKEMAVLKMSRYLKHLIPDATSNFEKSKVDQSCVSGSKNGFLRGSVEVAEMKMEEKPWEERARPNMPQLQEDRDLVTSVLMQADVALSSSGSSAEDWKKEEEDSPLPQRMEEELAAAYLLEWLNPAPLNPDAEDDQEVMPDDPKRNGVLVHSSVAIQPWQSLAQSPISDYFQRYLRRVKYAGLSVAQRFCWPHVFRGNDTLLVTHAGQDPLNYLPPLITQIQHACVHRSLITRIGPTVVILCPSWEKVQTVFDLLETSQAVQGLHPAMVLLGLNKEEAKAFRIQQDCQLLVTTPFTLVRLLEAKCSLFLRLCYLVMDEVDVLYSRAPKEMEVVLKHFRNVTSNAARSRTPQQLVAVGSRWNVSLEGLVKNYMVDATVIITVPKEAALYGGVHQMILLCLDCEKTPVMIRALDFSPSIPQKTLIITSCIDELEHVFEAVANSSALALKAHEGLTHEFDYVIQRWRKDIGVGTHIILVTTEKCLKPLGVDDATCVVHYGFPTSPTLFGSHLFCMSGNFRVLSDKYHPENTPAATNSMLLLTERNARHVEGVLRYLRRTDALLPPELLHFAQGVQVAKEVQKAHRPLCGQLKSLGFCSDTGGCPDRHILDKAQDDPLHLETGMIVVVPLYIKSANVYYGRVVRPNDTRFDELSAKMAAHYATEHRWATEVVEGELFAVQMEDEYHRVQVVAVPEKTGRLFSCVMVRFLDEGSTQEVKSHQLLQLPPQFHDLPPQAVEIILCGVRPIDNEVDWNLKVSRAISQKIRGKQHQAKVAMCLGNTIWVNPMVRRIPAPLLKTFINEYNVYSEVLSTGMGEANAEHMNLLRQTLEGPGGVADHSLLLSENPSEAILDLNELATCDAQGGSKEAPGESIVPGLEVLLKPLKMELEVPEPFSLKGMLSDCMTQAFESLVPSGEMDVPLKKHVELERFLPQSWTSSVNTPHGNGTDEQVVSPHINLNKHLHVDNSPQSCHPQVKWFQRQDVVILRVKLTNPVMQTCDFFPDRVLYSAYANGKHYRADLELQSNIRADRCSWDMKCNEPEIRLVKTDKGEWTCLLKQKNAFVSYDFDHIEDEEMSTAAGCCFVANTGEDGCYVTSESESESD